MLKNYIKIFHTEVFVINMNLKLLKYTFSIFRIVIYFKISNGSMMVRKNLRLLSKYDLICQ